MAGEFLRSSLGCDENVHKQREEAGEEALIHTES